MKRNAKEVGLFDAKTHLSQLIARVERGEEITITKRGIAVARLIPPAERRERDPRQAAASLRRLRQGLTLKGGSLRSLIAEGRL